MYFSFDIDSISTVLSELKWLLTIIAVIKVIRIISIDLHRFYTRPDRDTTELVETEIRISLCFNFYMDSVVSTILTEFKWPLIIITAMKVIRLCEG